MVQRNIVTRKANAKVLKKPKRRMPRRNQNPTTQRVAAATNVGVVYKMPTKRISSLPGGVIAVHNKEIILAPTATATAGVIAAFNSNIDVSVKSVGFSWLSKFDTIYDRFVFKALKITWVPTLPSTTSGSVAIFYDTEQDSMSGATFTTSVTNEAALVCPVFEQATIQVPPHLLNSLPWYSVTTSSTAPSLQGGISFSSTGVILLNNAAAGSTTVGYVMLEYIVHMKGASSV